MDQALRGDIYVLPRGANRLPDFRTLRPVAALYVRTLDVSDQAWRAGFPGVTRPAEGFAIDYHGTFTAAVPGRYRFSLISDDGSRLLIDGKPVVDNDGAHGLARAAGEVNLGPSPHRFEAQYFQGSTGRMALQLSCQRVGGGAQAVFPGCGLQVRTPGLWRLWLWWVATLASVGAGVIWMTRRRLAQEARGAL